MRGRLRGYLEPVEPELPKRPYRDSVLFHGTLAAVLVVVAFITAGSLARALAVAAAYFVVATAWSWWKFRQRIEQIERERP